MGRPASKFTNLIYAKVKGVNFKFFEYMRKSRSFTKNKMLDTLIEEERDRDRDRRKKRATA